MGMKIYMINPHSGQTKSPLSKKTPPFEAFYPRHIIIKNHTIFFQTHLDKHPTNMYSSILLLATLSAHSLAIAIARPYDQSVSWGELPGLEAYNYNLPAGDYLAQTPSIIITPNPEPIVLPAASTCGFPKRTACCDTNDFRGCHDAAETSFCSSKPLVCCDRVDITSRIGFGCAPLNAASAAPQITPQLDNTSGGTQLPATDPGQPAGLNQVPVPNVPDVAVPEGSPIWWLEDEQKKGQE